MTHSERWFGSAGHFICGQWCRFHLATQVGPWLVSTVGDFHSIGQMRDKGERTESEEIGFGRKYETMFFRAGPPCTSATCSCGLPTTSGVELDMDGYQTAGEATKGHYAMLDKWRNRPTGEVTNNDDS